MTDTQEHSLSGLAGEDLAEAVAAVAAIARERGLSGFGGQCWAAAAALNRVVFDGKGVLVAGLNAALLEGGAGAVGHAAVLFADACWDLDGKPKEETDIEAWGMLDPEDSDLRESAEEFGIAWDDEVAAEAGFWEFASEADFEQAVANGAFRDEVAAAEGILRSAMAAWRAAADLPSPGR